MQIRAILAMVVWTTLVISCSAEEYSKEQMKKLGESIFKYRDQIKSYDLVLDCKYNFIVGAAPGLYQNKTKLILDGNKRLWDKTQSNGIRSLYCENGDVEGYILQYGSDEKQNFRSGQYTKDDYGIKAHFPKILNLGLHGFQFDSGDKYDYKVLEAIYFSNPAHAQKAKLKGHEVLMLTITEFNNFKKNPFSQIRLWVDLEKGPSLVKFEQISDTMGSYDSEIDLQFDAASNLWFPSTVKFKLTRPKIGVTYEEEINVTINSLNKKIDPQVFKIENLDIPEGVKIRNDPTQNFRTTVINENKELVPPDAYGKPEPEPKEPSKWWGRVAVAACVLTLIFGFIYLRQRRLKAKSS
jgi:hypothetical protein